MKRTTLAGMAALIAVTAGLLVVPATAAYAEIPGWIRDVAGFWAEGSIDDDTFLNAITYLIDNGFIVLSADPVQQQQQQSPAATPPYKPAEPTFKVEEQSLSGTSSSLQAGIEDGSIVFNMALSQNAYDSGKKVVIPFELTSPGIANIKAAIFNEDQDTMWSGIVQTDEFGKGKLEFTAPTYYTNDRTLEIRAFFEDNTSTQRQVHMTINAIKVGTEFASPATYDDLAVLNVKLTVPVAAALELEIQDTDRNIIHQERIVTNEFGVGKSSGFAVPIHYRDSVILPATLTFAGDPEGNEHAWDISVSSVPVKVTVTTDKKTYNLLERMQIYVSVEPPTPGIDIKISGRIFEHGQLGTHHALSDAPKHNSPIYSITVTTNELGEGEAQAFAGIDASYYDHGPTTFVIVDTLGAELSHHYVFTVRERQ